MQFVLDCCADCSDRLRRDLTDGTNHRTNGALQSMNDYGIFLRMIITLIFFLGIGNFTMHKAVLESGHSFLEQIPGSMRASGGRLTLAVEFALLLAAMLIAANGWPAIAWGYAIYSSVNALSAWLILTRRV